KRVLAIVNLILILIWFYAILNVLNIRRDFMDWFTSILTYEIVLGSASFAFSDILLFFFVIYASVIISRILMTLLERDILTQFNLGKGLPHTIAVMVKYAIISIGVFLAITAVGMPMNSITVIAGAMGVGIGFGLQNIFNNIVSGFILLFERPIQIDDTIEVGTLIGKVKSIGIRASNIRTFDGADIIVPNGDLVSNQVVNWTLSDQQRRIEVFAGVAYGSDPHRVKELFEKVLSDHKDILNDPKPLVLFNGLGNSSLDFRLLFWTSNFYEWIHIKSDIIFGVHDILYKEGISIPFPQMDLHLKSIESPLEISKKYNKESS
ncbi:MAG: mechanosensitive ion channel protein MscS, partial [Marinilabiliales bacterium]